MNTTFFLNHSLPLMFRQRQQGAVLIVSLILLVILTMLGISAMESTKLETKMAVNTAEVNHALQIAEVGLALPTSSSYTADEIQEIAKKSGWNKLPKAVPTYVRDASKGLNYSLKVEILAAEGAYPDNYSPTRPRCAGNCTAQMIIKSTGCSREDAHCGEDGTISPKATLRGGISYGPIPENFRALTE